MFLSRKKKNNVCPCKPQFYNIKVGFRGSKLYRYVFVMNRLSYTSIYSTVSNVSVDGPRRLLSDSAGAQTELGIL